MKIEILFFALVFLSIVLVLTIYVSRIYKRKKAVKRARAVIEEATIEVAPLPDEIVVPQKKQDHDGTNIGLEADAAVVLTQENTIRLFEEFICSYLAESGFYPEDTDGLPGSEELCLFVKASDDSKIAAKCLWKPSCIKGRLEWGKSYQLVSLRNYQNQTGIPVFIIAGIGGTAEKPEMVSIIPLTQVRSNVLSQTQLKTYAAGQDNNFQRALINFSPQDEIEKRPL